MTDEKLNELEAVCSVESDRDGEVRLHARDVLELLGELRELRKHAADLGSHEGTIANLHRLLANLVAYGERAPSVGVTVSSRIAIQDPGR
ncbi:MAG: hypothetical protein ACREBN_04915 [Burkholderiaceae bacterium]